MFIDSHCHLDRVKADDEFRHINDRVAYTQKSGISHMLNVSIDLENWPSVIKIAEDNPNVYASVGVHPSDAHNPELSVTDLTDRAQHEKVIAIGETGLDYHYGKDNKTNQQIVFRTHIQSAIESKLPLIIHTREAQADTIDILREENAQKIGGIMHCFTENWHMAKKALDLGFYISFSGIITFKNADSIREVAQKTPMDRILIETDSPYLAPMPFRGKPNQPLYVKYVAEKMAEIKGLEVAEIAQKTSDNFARLFNLSL